MDESTMITKTDLKERGWTESVIRKHLGEPDALKNMPYFKKTGKMQLYKLTRVIEMEQNETVMEDLKKARKRSELAKKRASKLSEKLKEYIMKLEITVPLMPEKTLIENACSHYNSLWADRGKDDKHASPSDDEVFLNRIAVNYLRHELTIYEDELVRMFGKIGAVEGRPLLKERILDLIGDSYPFLANECDNQWIKLYES